MKTFQAAVCLAMFTTACAATEFSVAPAADGGSDQAADVQKVKVPKPDVGVVDALNQDAGADAGSDTAKPEHDAGVDTKPTPDSSSTDDAGHDAGSKTDAGDDSSSGRGDAGHDAMTGSDSGGDASGGDATTGSDSGSDAAQDGGPDAACVPTSCGPGNVPQAVCHGQVVNFPACSGADAVCLSGECVACAPGTNRCTTPVNTVIHGSAGSYYSGYQTCNSHGVWKSSVACSPGALVCNPSSGSCEATVCTPEAEQCAPVSCTPGTTGCAPDGRYQTTCGELAGGFQSCDDTGNWSAPQLCETLTFQTSCSTLCTPSTLAECIAAITG